MACPSISTGADFLVRTLAHLDCQAQTLGSFGFQSLASAGSPAATVLTALLTLFIAIYGVRLLFGSSDEPANLVNAVLKTGIVLTIAMSWPAWRIVAYDLVFYGPPDVAATIMPSTMPDPRRSLPQRLQGIDRGIAALAVAGTGRDTGLVLDRTGGLRSTLYRNLREDGARSRPSPGNPFLLPRRGQGVRVVAPSAARARVVTADDRQPVVKPISVRVPDAARLTGLSRSRIYELLKSGEIEFVKVGGSTLIPYDGLRAFIAGQRRRA